jgi:rare lipoprotein A
VRAAAPIVALCVLAGCAHAPAARQTPAAVGLASWYGARHAGHRTASGERFDPDALTAAHRTLPFGSRVRVTNVENGRSVVVRINDRGPFAEGRVIDLSEAAARAIGITESGLARVRLDVLH